MGRPVSGAGRGRRARGGRCRAGGPGDGGGLSASGCGSPGAGWALGLVRALSPRRLALTRIGFCLAKGGFQAGPGVPALCVSCPRRMPPGGGLGDGDASLEIIVLGGDLGGEARACGRPVGWRLGSLAPTRAHESTSYCTLSQEGDGGCCFGFVLAPKAGVGGCRIQGSELAPSLRHRPLSPSFGPLPREPKRAR